MTWRIDVGRCMQVQICAELLACKKFLNATPQLCAQKFCLLSGSPNMHANAFKGVCTVNFYIGVKLRQSLLSEKKKTSIELILGQNILYT